MKLLNSKSMVLVLGISFVPDDGLDGYQSALTNFRFLASDLWNTDEAMRAMSSSKSVASK